MIGNYGELTNMYVVNGVVREDRFFSEHFMLLQNSLFDRKFCPILQNVLLRDSNELTMVIFSYCQRYLDVSIEASKAIKLFTLSVVDPLTWFSGECMSRGMKVFGFQVLVWVLTMSDNIQMCVHTTGMEYMDLEVSVVLQELESKHKCVSHQLIKSLASELVENAISGPEKVKVLLNSLCQLFGRSDVRDSILEAVKVMYKMRSDKHEKLPCEAQILANCGTAFISHKGSYVLGDFHVYLAQLFFREAKRLLPDQVCSKQSSHLDKNIRIADLVPGIRKVLLGVNANTQLIDLQRIVADIPFLNSNVNKDPAAVDMKDICSAIKFVLQMTVNGSDPQGLEKVVMTLKTLSRLFETLDNKDLSKKCLEWASSASYKERVQT